MKNLIPGRLGRSGRAAGATDDGSVQPMSAAADNDDGPGGSAAPYGSANSAPSPSRKNKGGMGSGATHARALAAGAMKRLTKVGGAGRADYDDDEENNAHGAPPQDFRRRGGKGGNKKRDKGSRNRIQRWPYDDYHREQERYYESLEGQDIGGRGGNRGGSRRGGGDSDDDRFGYDDYRSGWDEDRGGTGGGGAGGGTESHFYERPVELPTIKDAVKNLSLADFEHRAQERAIGIVSMWLFDAGLIDELLVNGAVGSTGGAISGVSATPEQGVEVGAHGFPLLGADGAALKMDKEIEKLRSNAQRELSLINARLNDGVAASGTEVQELVKAVTQTKGELGWLRELCTYITDSSSKTKAGEGTKAVADDAAVDEKRDPRDEFLLSKNPRLKCAINARRNIGRCFRELEFFSQISSTCERLRDDLHSGEWTADEWNAIRNVSMEHVELEILLVEADAEMKARADDDASQDGGELQMGFPSEGLDRISSAKHFRGSVANMGAYHSMVRVSWLILCFLSSVAMEEISHGPFLLLNNYGNAT